MNDIVGLAFVDGEIVIDASYWGDISDRADRANYNSRMYNVNTSETMTDENLVFLSDVNPKLASVLRKAIIEHLSEGIDW